MHRREKEDPLSTIFVGKDTVVEHLILENVTTENATGQPMPLLENHGIIQTFRGRSLRTDGDAILAGDGQILERE